MENKTKIILSRKGEWMNRVRAFQVMIDGKEQGRVRNGSSEEFAVEPGTHSVTCKLGWCTSPSFSVTLNPGEIIYLRSQSNLPYYWPFALLLFAGIFVNFYFTMQGIHPKPIWVSYLQVAFMLPILIYLFYKVSFGRREYLQLYEDTENVFAN